MLLWLGFALLWLVVAITVAMLWPWLYWVGFICGFLCCFGVLSALVIAYFEQQVKP